MPIVFPTGEMITELERVRAEVNGLLESLGMTFNVSRLKERFAYQLEACGVSKTEAESLAEGLISWIASTRGHLEGAETTAGSALHVLSQAQSRSRYDAPMV